MSGTWRERSPVELTRRGSLASDRQVISPAAYGALGKPRPVERAALKTSLYRLLW